MKLRVAPIAAEIHKAALTQIFEEYGEVYDLHILRSDRESIAVVDMVRDGEAKIAMKKLDNTEVGGINVRVESWHDHATIKGAPKPISLDDDEEEEVIEEINVAEVEDTEADED